MPGLGRCFNRLGEIRDRSFENQRHRASGLNLLVAAITLWNTSTSPAITRGTQIKGWLKVGSEPFEYPETASARLNLGWLYKSGNAPPLQSGSAGPGGPGRSYA